MYTDLFIRKRIEYLVPIIVLIWNEFVVIVRLLWILFIEKLNIRQNNPTLHARPITLLVHRKLSSIHEMSRKQDAWICIHRQIKRGEIVFD